jgi:isoleucyl-tRNA synthetase
VSTSDGTGIVHIAPAYGEDDYRVGRAAGIELVDPLDEQCCFTDRVPDYAGQFCKDADKAIIKRLKDEGKLVHQGTIVHSYPFCERSGAPLIYRAMEAWYVRVSDLRPRMQALNREIRWVPDSVGSNRFGNFIADGPDWNISRNRFWGSCLPVWVNEADPDDRICVGSVAELERLAGLPAGTVTDLHKHHLDGIVIRREGRTYRRTPEVLDCWFESGAMPYAQVHWMGGADGTQAPPVFPAQFIAEGLDQTRGWFYSLLVLSAALFDKPAFRNVVVNGLVLAEDGQKMSKSKQNYPDPHKVLDAYGADALRAYLIDSPVVRAEPLRFSEAGLKEIVRTVVLPYWNALGFFTTYASVDGFTPADPAWAARPLAQRHALDRWLVRALESLIRDVNTEMEAYRLYTVVPRLVQFIDDLTNWYIRCSRRRFWRSEDSQVQADAYHTLYGVLVEFAKVLAPFMPFLTEEVYQRLVVAVDPAAPASIHWCDYPQAAAADADAIVADMAWVQRAVALGRKLREDQKLKIRQPLASFTVVHRDPAIRAAIDRYAAIIADELNVKAVRTDADETRFASVSVKPNFAELRKRCGPKLKEIGAALAAWTAAEIGAVEAGGTVACCGEQLGAADVLLQRSAKPGLAVTTDGTLTVSMDTVVTDALKAEGHAREAISLLQQARKDAGLEVSDRIRVTWATDAAELAAALRQHAAVIADEVLAVTITEGAIDAAPADCNGMALRLAVTKA